MKHLSIADLEQSGPHGSVWVRNTGPQSVYELTGDILMAIPGNAGQQAQALKVPSTWLPVDLTMFFPKHRILESNDFRAAVRNGLLTIITEQEAQKLLREDGAREEQKRILAEAKIRRDAGAARTISDSNVEISRADGVKDEEENPVEVYGREDETNVAKAAAHGLDLDEQGLTASFVMFASKIGTEPDVKALNALKTRAKFSRRELKYLRDNLRNHPKTVTAIKSKLSEMSSTKRKAAV